MECGSVAAAFTVSSRQQLPAASAYFAGQQKVFYWSLIPDP
jgi:hypothetical protein